jgi:renalase
VTAVNAVPRRRHVAVIGAGLAGLSCATALHQADVRVTVFDKSRGSSGRMSTRRQDDWQCDHGAQYFTARDPAFQLEVARWQNAGVAELWRPRLHVLNADGATNSASTVQRFVGTPRMTSPAAFLAASLLLRTGCTIEQLQHMPGVEDDAELHADDHANGEQRAGIRWRLRSKEDGWLEDVFDAVLVAVPAPQVAPLLLRTTAQSDTEPSLQADSRLQTEPSLQLAPGMDALATLAAETNMSGCWTMMLRFTAPSGLATRLPFDAAFVNHGPLRWICSNSNKPGRSGPETWLLHANPVWSAAHIEQDASTVGPLLVQAFIDLGGIAPDAWTAHRWRHSMAEPALEQVYAWDPALAVGLCGDWINGGKVEGAWLSGRALAQQALVILR